MISGALYHAWVKTISPWYHLPCFGNSFFFFSNVVGTLPIWKYPACALISGRSWALPAVEEVHSRWFHYKSSQMSRFHSISPADILQFTSWCRGYVMPGCHRGILFLPMPFWLLLELPLHTNMIEAYEFCSLQLKLMIIIMAIGIRWLYPKENKTHQRKWNTLNSNPDKSGNASLFYQMYSKYKRAH